MFISILCIQHTQQSLRIYWIYLKFSTAAAAAATAAAVSFYFGFDTILFNSIITSLSNCSHLFLYVPLLRSHDPMFWPHFGMVFIICRFDLCISVFPFLSANQCRIFSFWILFCSIYEMVINVWRHIKIFGAFARHSLYHMHMTCCAFMHMWFCFVVSSVCFCFWVSLFSSIFADSAEHWIHLS